MASNKLRLQSFRINDLVNDGGKQFELGKSWCDDFFEFDKTRPEVVVNLKFKAIQMSHVSLNDKIIELKLADVSIRGDRKAYVNGNNGMSQIKDFFINNLHLTPENNLTDYFAIYKVSEFDYYLYFVPSLLYKNFLQFFKSVLPTVSINHNNEDLRTAEKASLQQIFYGAPGTGKSHNIKDNVDVKASDEKNLVFRTTFHPDSDYSTFVGAYKTTTTKRAVRNVAGDIVRDTNKEEVYEDCITYSFIPQAFLQAYVAAWNNPEDKVFLVIEEINRGNCAQIFGDLFQLLDRDDEGASEYPIMADKDISKYLNGNDEEGRPVLTNKDGIKDGKLRLPKNLYIWATMNTSDQSLFPIDSAFKRRWEWKYIKIKEGKDENGNKLDWKVDVKMDEEGTLLPWWDFIKKINEIIASMTSSADKQLGYFFCCAKDGVIDEETFVSKVIFYLWNDVFKDYGFEDASLFRYTTKDKEGKNTEKDLSFPDFYDEEGEKVNTERLTDFVKKVMNWKKTNAEQD